MRSRLFIENLIFTQAQAFFEDMLSISAPEDNTVLCIPAVRYSCMIRVTHVGVTCPAALHKEVTKSTCVLIV